ncbi:hypothetical protein ACEN4P_12765, partial [Marinilactibacillus psychrotolerans]
MGFFLAKYNNTLQFQSNYYSVPIGTYQPRKTTKVRITTSDTHLYAYDMKSDRLIAQHPLTKGKGKLIKDSNHGREEDKRQKL